MQILTGKYTAALAPSSMNAGNTTAGDPQLALTAPGSLSVLPVAEKMDVLPMPRWTNSTPFPLSHPGLQKKITPAQPETQPFPDVHGVPAASLWKETH